MDNAAMKMHIREHMDYPATKKQIVEACTNMSELPEDDRKWVMKKLPDRTYKNANEVIKALKL